MGRPPTPVGTFGRITFVGQPSGTILARARIRDFDGRSRLVSKVGASRAAAERALRSELAHRQAPGGDTAVTAATRVTTLADVWLESAHGWATGTERTYRSVVHHQVKPALGQLRLREVTPGVVSRAISSIAVSSGPGAARTTRACLSGMFGLAVRDGAVPVNPVRDAVARLSPGRKIPRALSVAETRELVSLFRTSPSAGRLDLPDLVDWMLATGARIGEALAVRFGTNHDGGPLLDLEVGTWEVNATVVRVSGRGLVVQPRPKTAAGWRVIALPSFAVRMLRARSASKGLVFLSPFSGTLRDPTNVSADLRQLLDGFECDACNRTGYRLDAHGEFLTGPAGRRLRCDQGPWSWVTSHTFRKTVATRLDDAGFTPRQVADQLGHANPSMTLDVYFGRHVVSAESANVLDR